MSSSLEQRFLNFLATLPGSESLDQLLAGHEYVGERRADYLLFDRRLIVEVKSLETDTSTKVESEMAQHRDRDDFPLIYGEADLQKVLKHLPDGKEINDRIFLRTTRSIELATRSAEEQIENTARLLKIPRAVGIMVLLNQDIEIFSPEVVAARVGKLMQRTKTDGISKSPIVVSCLIFESHTLTHGPVEKSYPIVLLEGTRARDFPWISELLNYLQVAWGEFNGHRLIKADARSWNDLASTPSNNQDQHKPGDKVSRQQMWEINYRTHPYLRPLSDVAVLEAGQRAIEALLPYFLAGELKMNVEKIEPMMIAWSDFLCEARHRGLDLRYMPKPNMP